MLAVPPENNEAFFREVDDELRREQLTGFWRRWRIAIIGGLVIGLAALGGFLWWQHDREQKAAADGLLLDDTLAAMDRGEIRLVPANLTKLSHSHVPAYRASAMMTQAALAAMQGDQKGAVAKYGSIVADESLAQPFRDAALVRQTATEYDLMQPQAVIDRLKPLAVPGNPWFGSAGEMTAIAMLKLNRPQDAATLFAAIAKDEQAPETVRRRATQMAGSLGVDAIADPARNDATTQTNEKDQAE